MHGDWGRVARRRYTLADREEVAGKASAKGMRKEKAPVLLGCVSASFSSCVSGDGGQEPASV